MKSTPVAHPCTRNELTATRRSSSTSQCDSGCPCSCSLRRQSSLCDNLPVWWCKKIERLLSHGVVWLQRGIGFRAHTCMRCISTMDTRRATSDGCSSQGLGRPWCSAQSSDLSLINSKLLLGMNVGGHPIIAPTAPPTD